MKKLAFNKITAGIALLMTCQVAFATSTTADVGGGTITFYGAVTDATCNVTTNSGSDFAVDLNPITRSDMGTAIGLVQQNSKQFTLNVDGCAGFNSTSTTAQTLKITFSGGNVSENNTYLKNTTGTSSGVGIGITKDGSTLIALNSALDTDLKTTSSDGTNFDTAPAAGTINYYANYYNYGGAEVKSGSVITTATYTFNYD